MAVGHTITSLNTQVGDRHIAPPTSSAIYSERLLLLPRCYQINDHAQAYRGALKPPPPSELTRRFTYANFNQLMKVSADVLDTWAGAMLRTRATRVVLLTGVTSARLQCAEIQPRYGRDVAPTRRPTALPLSAHHLGGSRRITSALGELGTRCRRVTSSVR